MANLIFLEAATQSSSAASIIESNESLINFATAEVDALVGFESKKAISYVSESLEDTKTAISNSIFNSVYNSSREFSSIIASDLNSSEKKELIEAYSYAYISDDDELKELLCFGAGAMALSMAGGMAGSKVGHAVGNAVGGLASRLSAAHKQWKQKVKEVDTIQAQMKGKPNPVLKKKLAHLEQEKTKAHAHYLEVKTKYQGRTNMVTGLAGGMAGSIGARVAGAAHGIV